MNKDAVTIGMFLVFIFIITMTAHMLFVKGYAFELGGYYSDDSDSISIYSTREECEQAVHGGCVLELCDNISAGKSHEDVCGEGFKEIWRSEKTKH